MGVLYFLKTLAITGSNTDANSFLLHEISREQCSKELLLDAIFCVHRDNTFHMYYIPENDDAFVKGIVDPKFF